MSNRDLASELLSDWEDRLSRDVQRVADALDAAEARGQASAPVASNSMLGRAHEKIETLRKELDEEINRRQISDELSGIAHRKVVETRAELEQAKQAGERLAARYADDMAKAGRELGAARAEVERLERTADAEHAKLVEVADKLRAERAAAEPHPWEAFLTGRARAIAWMHSEGKSDAVIASELSMDAEHVWRIRRATSDTSGG